MPTPSQPNPNLKEFLSSQSEEAFRQLVAEFGGLVYSSALRRTGERELAEEITQTVFAILARKAATVARHPSLTGWLFTVTKFEAAKAMRTRHRHQRKIAALTLETPQSAPSDIWQNTLPHLDEFLDRLPKQERDLLLARYVEEKPYQILAQESGKSEAACKMQIKRILEKLKTSLTSRGATVSVTTLSLALSSELSPALPITLAASLPTQALAAAASLKTGSLSTTQLIHFMNTVKTSTIALAVIAVCAIPIGIQHASAVKLRKELVTLHEHVPTSAGSSRVVSGISDTHSARPTPVGHFLAELQPPRNGQEFLAALQAVMMNQNIGGIVKIILPLNQADIAKIKSLISEVEACDDYPIAKATGLEMLLQISGDARENPGETMERSFAGGANPDSQQGVMSKWIEDDKEAALAWFREKMAKGDLIGKGTKESPEGYLAIELVGKLGWTDHKTALALVEEVEPLSRDRVIAKLAPTLVRRGRDHRPDGIRLIESMNDPDERFRTINWTAHALSWTDRDQVRPFLEELTLSEMESGSVLASVASANVFERPESVPDRMAWLLETVSPAELDDAVKRAIDPLTQRMPEEVTEWIKTLDQGAVHDAAIEGQISYLEKISKVDEATQRAGLITDPNRREVALERLRSPEQSKAPNTTEKTSTSGE